MLIRASAVLPHAYKFLRDVVFSDKRFYFSGSFVMLHMH